MLSFWMNMELWVFLKSRFRHFQRYMSLLDTGLMLFCKAALCLWRFVDLSETCSLVVQYFVNFIGVYLYLCTNSTLKRVSSCMFLSLAIQWVFLPGIYLLSIYLYLLSIYSYLSVYLHLAIRNLFTRNERPTLDSSVYIE